MTTPSPNRIRLPKKLRRAILIGRVAIFLVALGITLWGAFRLFFPIAVTVFNFDKPDSLANTFFNPHDDQGNSLANGQLDNAQTLVTTTGLAGAYSTIRITLTPSKKSLNPAGTTATLRKSFTSFFYPADPQPAAFPAGTLLTSENHYAIIDTSGRRVDFDSPNTVKLLGYDPAAFLAVSPEEFNLNQTAPSSWDLRGLSQTENPINYPTGTLFLIDNVYYQLQMKTDSVDTELARFVSENAYLTRYEKNQAIPKDSDFLKNFSIADQWLGFADGTLLSFDTGIFVVNNGILSPIGDPTIFVALGFDWDRVLPASEEELGIYERGRIILLYSPQPAGTVFIDQNTGNTSIVTPDHTRRLITSRTLRDLLTRHTTPIRASLGQSVTCSLQPTGLFTRTYDCDAALDALADIPGHAYELTLQTPTRGIRFNAIETSFATVVRVTTLRETVSLLKQRILSRYTPQ